MRILHSLPLVLLAACSTGPSKQDSARVLVATTLAASTAQSAAVSDARTHASAAPGSLAIDFSGTCAAGGTVRVTGTYDGSGNDDSATFDMTMTFAGCRGVTGDLVDGDLHWSSTASGTGFSETMTGQVAFSDASTSASCDFDMTLAVTPGSVSYAGSMCGYDASALVTIGR